MKRNLFKASLLAILPLNAFAHHPMGGETPQNFIQGFLSGIGHPIIELDHFLFVIGFAALVAVGSRHTIAHLTIFLTTAAAGTVARFVQPELGFLEAAVFASIALVGTLLLAHKLDRLPHLWFIAPIGGAIHGYAYGGAIVGAESTPIFAYLAGFSIVQAALMLTIVFVVRSKINAQTGNKIERFRMVVGSGVIGLAFFV